MKSRIVIWSIVGLIVVVGLVLLFSSRSRRAPGRAITLETVKADARQSLRQVDRLEQRLADAVKVAPTGTSPGPAAAEAGQLLLDARARLGHVAEASDAKAAEAELRDAKHLLRQARRNVEVAAKGRAPTPGL